MRLLCLQVVGTAPDDLASHGAGGRKPPNRWGWQASATDSTAALQEPGSIGLRSYYSAGAKPSPLVAAFRRCERDDDRQLPSLLRRTTPAQWPTGSAPRTWGAARVLSVELRLPRTTRSTAVPERSLLRLPDRRSLRRPRRGFLDDVSRCSLPSRSPGQPAAVLNVRCTGPARPRHGQLRCPHRHRPHRRHLLQLQLSNVTLVQADIAGLTYVTGDRIKLRLQVVGTAPTTLRARAWKVGTSEPAA